MLTKILRYGEGRTLKRLDIMAKYVEDFAAEVTILSDEELQAKTAHFRSRIAGGESLDDLLVEAFAVAREASYRILKQKHFHVQIMGGVALHFGNIAEMRTGEGKTLTCVLPAYLNALSGKGVHVVTTNDYLARRDAEWMGRIHKFLGLTVDVISPDQDPQARSNAYKADITYGTNNEFGFDYLRDNMVQDLSSVVQNGHNYAIVDEVDSILIDEARTPLIISGPAETSSKWYTEFARIAKKLKQDIHYEVDLRKRAVGITEEGVFEVENQLGIDNLYETNNAPLVSYLNNALKALKLFEKDKDYIVSQEEVIIVDEFTGRMLHGRRFNEGLHQAIEAKEGVEIKAENQTLATITLQNYFRLYKKLAGMTGTAQTEAAEFHQIYKLGVVSIPTNKPVCRKDNTDLIYRTEVAKFNAVVDDVIERHELGQPVLIGTASVERSEYLSLLLTKNSIPHTVLNAKNHENEASIIARAGLPGAVTVATNMAGRGTDIVLGGNIDIIADEIIRASGLDPIHQENEYQQAWEKTVAEVTQKANEDADKVRGSGGLYVIGTEHHDSRRIDNQLRGRTGRQGDPGETRFFLSVQDELIRRFNGAMLEAVMQRLGIPEEVPIDQKMITRAINSAQTQVEQLNFELRKDVLKYDEVMNQQRLKVYSERNTILQGEDLRPTILGMIEDVISAYIKGATGQGFSEDWDLDTLWGAFESLYPISVQYQHIFGQKTVQGERKDISARELRNLIVQDARNTYEKKFHEITTITGDDNTVTMLERTVLLAVLDQKWQEHLYEMDYLKEGISLRAMAQKDPLVEYQRESFTLFQGMVDALKEETVRTLFSVQVIPHGEEISAPLFSGSDISMLTASHDEGKRQSQSSHDVQKQKIRVSQPSKKSAKNSKNRIRKR